MHELTKIIDIYRQNECQSLGMALATVVKVAGSVYRRPGARMFILENGQWNGSVSGGCLDGKLLEQAQSIINSKQPTVLTFNTGTKQSSSNGTFALGCEGAIHILIEPLEQQNDPKIALLERIIQAQSPAVLTTVIDDGKLGHIKVGQKLYWQNDSYHNTSGISELYLKAFFEASAFTRDQKHTTLHQIEFGGHKVEIVSEIIEPEIQLIIFGGGYDVLPVIKIAKVLGWKTVVIEENTSNANGGLFADADKHIQCAREKTLKHINLRKRTAAILMSHNCEYDLSILSQLFSQDIDYIGILGPKRRYERMLKRFDEMGVEIRYRDRKRVYSPIGLDIGSETPEEIALSIIAEIQAHFNNKEGFMLKKKQKHIHDRTLQKVHSLIYA